MQYFEKRFLTPWIGTMDNQEQSAEELFEVALDMPPEKRAAYLDQACHDAPELRQIVEALLLENDRAGSFMAEPLVAPQGSSKPSSGSTETSRQLPRDDGQSLLHHRPYRLGGNGRDL